MEAEREPGEARRLLTEARDARTRGDVASAKTKLRAAADAAKRSREPLARGAAFVELLRDSTARLADPRGQAGEDAILVALKGAIALSGAERGFVASRRAPGADPTFVAGLDWKGQKLQGTDFNPSFTIVKSV